MDSGGRAGTETHHPRLGGWTRSYRRVQHGGAIAERPIRGRAESAAETSPWRGRWPGSDGLRRGEEMYSSFSDRQSHDALDAALVSAWSAGDRAVGEVDGEVGE